MEPISLALAVVGLVATGFASGVGEEAGNALIARVVSRFGTADAVSEDALNAAFEEDPAFFEEIGNLYRECRAIPTFNNDFHGPVGKFVQVNELHGDINL